MSPARARTSSDAIVAAARALLEGGGLGAVTMQAVADAVGVRAPSLYKRFDGRAALITAVADDVAAELGADLAPALQETDPREAIRAMSKRQRAFARSPLGRMSPLFSKILPETKLPHLNAALGGRGPWWSPNGWWGTNGPGGPGPDGVAMGQRFHRQPESRAFRPAATSTRLSSSVSSGSSGG